MVAIAFNKADDSEELSDEARLAQSLARMRAAIGDTGDTTDVQSLIAAHKDAQRAFLPLCDEHEAADDALRAALKGKLYPGPFTTSYEMGYGRDWVFEHVSNEIERHRGHLRILEKLDPTAHEAALRALDEVEERQESEIDAAFAAETATYDEVDARYVTASDRERNALLEICSHRCSTPEQYQLKGDYLASFSVRDSLDVAHIDALITSLKTDGASAPISTEDLFESYRAGWEKVRELGKQLSSALDEVGDCEFAYIGPAGVIMFGNNPSNEPDPLSEAIEAYRAGTAAFGRLKEEDWPLHGGEEAVIAQTYGTPLEVLENWEQPALSRRGALEALRFAQEENSNFASNPTVVAMVAAALAYFENEQRHV